MKRLQNRRYFGAFSYVFIYSWYNTYWRDYKISPVAEQLGPLAGSAEMFVTAGVLTGVIIALSLPWPRLVEKRKPLKILVHVFAFLPFWVFPFLPSIELIAPLALVGGFCIGAVVVRSFYSMFFEIMDLHPAKVIVVGYVIIQSFIHINDIVPLVNVPLLYYALSGAALLAGVVLGYFKREEEELERRRILPENKFRLSHTWQILALVALLQTCSTLYGDILLPQTNLNRPLDEILNIVPDVVMFLLLGFFGKKLKLMGALYAFLALFACTIGAYFIFGEAGRIPMQLFMEPAYRLVDFVLVWILIIVFFTYGKSQARLKACIAVFFVVRFGTLAFFGILISALPPTTYLAYITLVPAFLTALLLPAAQRELNSMEAQRAFAERYQGVNVPLPSEKEDVLEASKDLMATSPQGTTLTPEEHTALCYLLDGQDVDITAYFMGLSAAQVRELNRGILPKLGVASNAELMMKLGEARTEKKSRARREELFKHYSLTTREQELAALLLSGMPAKNVPGAMGVSQGTVNFHSQNLYRKLNIQSRAELSSLFVESANT